MVIDENQQEYLKFLLKVQNLSLLEFKDVTSSVISINGFLVQSLFELKPSLNEGEVYLETLTNKIIYTSQSILNLAHGCSFTIKKYDTPIEVIDTTSIFILTRSIIEGFLSLEYLYFNELDREEQLFRFKLWQVSGLMSRQKFANSISERFKEKMERERVLVEQLKEEIKSSKYYTTLKGQKLYKFDTYGLPRLESWGELLSQSILKNSSFEKTYMLYTNYAHSEYLAMMQLHEGSLHKLDSKNLQSVETVLNIVCMINSSLSTLLLKKFPILSQKYDELEKSVKYPIDYWSRLAKMS